MRLLTLDLADNPLGADPTVGFFKALKLLEPTLNKTNVKIKTVQSFESSDYPNRTIVTLSSLTDNLLEYQFIYDRFDIEKLLEGFKFTTAEKTSIKNAHSSTKLVNVVATRKALNLKPVEFWTHPNYLELAGGSSGDNFILEPAYDNLWFTGKCILSL